MNPVLGQVVYSKAGRDQGRKFIVFGIVDEIYVYLVDGKLRKIEKPKKKKIKHLKTTEEVNQNIAKKLKENLKITNSEVRKYIESNVIV